MNEQSLKWAQGIGVLVGKLIATALHSLVFAVVLMKVFTAFGFYLVFVVAPDPPPQEIRPDHTFPYTPPLRLERLARR